MYKSWTNQNVDLSTLTEKLANFLENEEFDITVYKEEKGYSITANNSPKYQIEGYITIQVNGEPNNFSIRMEGSSEGASSLRLPPLLMTMFGGGYFLLKKLKSNEKYIEFTRNFWQNVNKILLQLKNVGEEGDAKPSNRG
ncbi:MAG: hypothetical protein ACPLW8_05565 [Candidatus Bathyarchaeales archaeon]